MSCSAFLMDIKQGADYLAYVTRMTQDGTPIDITGATFTGSIAAFAGGPDIQDLTIALLDAPNGRFTVSLTAAQTAALAIPPNTSYLNVPTLWTFDVKMVLAGVTTRILMGAVSVSPGVTV